MGLFGSPNIDKMKANRDVEGLIKVLGSQKDYEMRSAAADALGQIGDARVVEPLIAALEDWSVREAVRDALGKIRAPRAVETLIAALKDSRSNVRDAAAGALGQVGDARAVEPLVAALKDSDSKVRNEVADALETMGWQPDQDERGAAYWIGKRKWDMCVEIGLPAVGPLIAALKDSDKDVREFAEGALLKIGKPAVELLIAALQDDDKDVRVVAARALGQIGDARAAEPLIAALKNSYWNVHEEPLDAPEEISDVRTVRALITALKDRGNHSRNMHEAAAYALGQIGDARSVEPLIMAIKDRGSHWHNLHEAFIYVFREILPLDPKPLTIALKESREDMDKAADALVKIGMPAIEPLIAALNDSSCCVGEAVVGALDKMGWLPGRDESGANYWVAKGEYWMCIGIGAPAVAPLMARIKERTRHYRYSRKSADALQRRGLHPNPLNDALKGIMNDMDKTADALVKIGKHAIDPLTALLDDRDEYVRILAKGALAIIGKPAVDTPITAGSEAMSTAPLFGEGTDEKATGIAIRLVDSGSMMINVIKVIREVTGVGLQEAKDIVKGTPRIVKDDLSKDEATAIKMKFEEVGAKIEIVDSAEAISSERKNTATTIFGFFTRTEGDALVISISDPEKWKNTLRTRLELNDADVVLFEEKDWLTQELKSKSIDELKKKNSQIISTIEKKLLLQGVPKSVIAEVVKKIEVIPNPISGLVVFVVAYSGDFANYNH